MERTDGRNNDGLRKVNIIRNFNKYAEGSTLIEFGDTRVICTATIEEKVPPFMKGTGEGWITSEYGMLPRSTQSRKQREASRGKIDGRTAEIQRLIGRALRSIVDLKSLGERTILIDCDVIQADGGTRTASITGAFVALVDAVNKLDKEVGLIKYPVRNFVAAISIGILDDEYILDLCYTEDSKAKVDMNIIMTDKGEYVEIQGTGEEGPFTKEDMKSMLCLAEKGINELIDIQKKALGEGILRIGEEYKEDESNLFKADNSKQQ